MKVAIVDDMGYGYGQPGFFGKELYVDLLVRINTAFLDNHVVKLVLRKGRHGADYSVTGWDVPLVRPVLNPGLKRPLRKILEEHGVQILHFNLPAAGDPRRVAQVAQELGIPAVCTVHNWQFVCPTTWGVEIPSLRPCGNGFGTHCVRSLWHLGRLSGGSRLRTIVGGVYLYQVLRALLRASAAIISPSRALADRIREVHGLERVYWVRNPAPESLLSLQPQYRGERAVVFLGRLAYEKGAHLLPIIARSLPDVQFHVMGSGPLEGFLRAYAAKHPHLILHGFVSALKKVTILRNSTALVMPSLTREAFGYSVLEAFALGKPVIGFSLGGVQELIEDSGGGLAVPPCDLRVFSSRIRDVIEDAELARRLGEAGRKYTEGLTPRRYALDLAEIYQSACAIGRTDMRPRSPRDLRVS